MNEQNKTYEGNDSIHDDRHTKTEMNQPKIVVLMLFDEPGNPGGMLCGHCER